MKRDQQRIERVTRAMSAAGLDALVCAAPENVLMLTGYWPVVGASVAVVTAWKHVIILAPSDEKELAKQGWADQVVTFEPATLDELRPSTLAAVSALDGQLLALNIRGTIGCEDAPSMRPASYVAQQVYSDSLHRAAKMAGWVSADSMLSQLRQVLTSGEITRLKLSCQIAQRAFKQCVEQIRIGMSEAAIAGTLQQALSAELDLNQHRAMGFAYCMSGPNAYEAFAAYQRSRNRPIQKGDLMLLHCNSCVDGFWTDITRSFVAGEPDQRQQRIFQAIFEARAAALKSIQPGITGARVDTAARDVMKSHGFEKEFKHPTGHGVGFAAIDHNAPPHLHPTSTDRLEDGMAFNVEPGIYIEGYGGARHCDMVAVSASGHSLLTDFLSTGKELVLPLS